MDTVTILRHLWRRRILVTGVFVFAILVGAALHFRLPSLDSRRYDVGVATINILVDTPSSQVVNVAPRGSDTTGARASLLASLMVGGDIESMIAHRAGVNASQLVATTGAVTNPSSWAGGGVGQQHHIPAGEWIRVQHAGAYGRGWQRASDHCPQHPGADRRGCCKVGQRGRRFAAGIHEYEGVVGGHPRR